MPKEFTINVGRKEQGETSMSMRKKVFSTAAIIALSIASSGCVLVAAAGAGYLIHDEATEGDGKFDPLEDVRDEEDGKN